ncbi:CxC2 domain-containing protein [Mycena sanguinolenta]|uniref:CxC2 domain-containing protein n=1 Tax=Mycena sanguinolenta TaxID=230812 RepID=A0A8H6ZDZ2_9AGAR|nr:CxC2 domain-containing protein [Mycena sanguinolenta]
MDSRKKRKREVYKHTTSVEESSAANASKRRVHVERHPAPPRSPEKGRDHDYFDTLMGFADDYNGPTDSGVIEGPAALKIKVKKAKRYENSDHPVKTWIPERDNYMDGLLQLKGRGTWWSKGCVVCKHPNPTWRCEDCFGNRLLCGTCITEKHRDEPLHFLEEWEDGYFQFRTIRDDLKLTYQIGHPFGEDCEASYLGKTRSMVVLDNNGIHVVNVDFCGCPDAPSEVAQLLNIGWYPATHTNPSTAATLSLLGRFHKLNLQARLPAYDFYNTKLPNRLPQFMNIVREYRHLQMCKRAGRGHDPEGISGTGPGELAIPCRACPHPDINLPEGWDKAPAEIAWIYRLMVSEDANFKMKGRDRSSRDKDPTLGPGWAYMVASNEYLSYLVKHIHEDEITHCVSFAALWSANNKRAKGLRASGVGSVSCSRHEVFRPLGTGDLQRGENNMDYLFLSSLMGIVLLTVIASYDIACQWSRNFWKRAEKVPEKLKLPDWLEIIFKVPKFHLPPHVKKCHAPYSFNYTKGVGRTDGEGVERNWSWLNSAARSVSVMGPGAREDTIDDLCGFSNWKKTIDLGNSLLRKMVLAIPQAMIHSRAFTAFTEGLREGHEEELCKWEKMVRDWEADEDASESPYDYAEVEGKCFDSLFTERTETGLTANTMADVLARLAAEEHERVVKHGVSALVVKPGPFLIAGIQIQEEQAALRLEAKRLNRTTIQATALQRARTLLLGKVKALHDIQDTYMPVCVTALVDQEDALRNAQADEALRNLRSGLRTRTFAHKFKRKHTSGQGAYTKSRELLDGIEDRIRSAATRYRAARAALLALRGPGHWENVYQELQKEDIRGMNERLLNEEEKEENRKARVLAGLPADADGADIDEYGEPVELTVLFNLETGEGRRRLSWIWYTGMITDSDTAKDGSLHEDIRIEWTKARARADRWKEELILLEEEMRRVLQFCGWKKQWWQSRVNCERDVSPELREGLRAYALAQAARERSWEIDWETKWAAVRERAKAVMRDHIIDVSALLPLEVELDEEMVEEDEYDDFDEEQDE